jgi:hypothetical protein
LLRGKGLLGGFLFCVWHGQHEGSGMGLGGVGQSVAIYPFLLLIGEYSDKGWIRTGVWGLYGITGSLHSL